MPALTTLWRMPEGHVIHRLARELNAGFTAGPLKVSSPQGRFSAEAALLDGARIARAEAVGKHLFVDFDTPHPEHIVYIHLGLIGQLKFEPAAEQAGQIRLRISDGVHAAHLRGPQWCRLITDEEYAAIRAKSVTSPVFRAECVTKLRLPRRVRHEGRRPERVPPRVPSGCGA